MMLSSRWVSPQRLTGAPPIAPGSTSSVLASLMTERLRWRRFRQANQVVTGILESRLVLSIPDGNLCGETIVGVYRRTNDRREFLNR